VTIKIDRDTDLTAVLNEEIWPRIQRQTPTGVRPRLAATLILLDRTEGEPKVLMGRRNPASKFMPGKFVFPGGRIEPGDRKMNAAGALPKEVEFRLAKVLPRSASLPRALALGSIRETFEETGIVLGARDMGAPDSAPDGEWRQFAAQGFYPQLDNIHFIARATTPPRQARRFDTVFLAAEATDIVANVDGFIGPDRELVELVWVPMSKAHDLELPLITSVVLHELDRRIEAGMAHYLPAPWYYVGPRGWVRKEL
jgi:8-oxo-dGTP pyrophosphatase MutT (NUDIX family)